MCSYRDEPEPVHVAYAPGRPHLLTADVEDALHRQRVQRGADRRRLDIADRDLKLGARARLGPLENLEEDQTLGPGIGVLVHVGFLSDLDTRRIVQRHTTVVPWQGLPLLVQRRSVLRCRARGVHSTAGPLCMDACPAPLADPLSPSATMQPTATAQQRWAESSRGLIWTRSID